MCSTPLQDLAALKEVANLLGKQIEVRAALSEAFKTLLCAIAPMGRQSTLTRCVFQEQEVAISGRNWGNATIEQGTLVFRVGTKPAFRVPLQDVGQVQQGKEEVSPPIHFYQMKNPQMLSPVPMHCQLLAAQLMGMALL